MVDRFLRSVLARPVSDRIVEDLLRFDLILPCRIATFHGWLTCLDRSNTRGRIDSVGPAFPGQTALVARLVGCPEHVRRLEEMGVRPGIRVQMLQRGKPCIVRAGVNRLCFRCSDLLGILVSDCHVTR